MNALGADEAVLFVDAVHPTHGARAAGCWAAKDEHLAIEQTTGRHASISMARSISRLGGPK